MKEICSWWKQGNSTFFMNVCNKINIATHEESSVDKCSYFFQAMNSAWNEFYKYRKNNNLLNETEKKEKRSDMQAINELISRGINNHDKKVLCESKELESFVSLQPQIMNHETLLRREYDPENINNEIRKDATEEHRKLLNAYKRYIRNGVKDDFIEPLLKKLSCLLYIVRSNIAHGEKTPHGGPDKNKVNRDNSVCEVTIPLIHLILNLIFDKPNQKLAVYGTLAPGETNARILEEIKGSWETGKVSGTIMTDCGLPFFKWVMGKDKVKINIFVSEHLQEYWDSLDRYEGTIYRRILVPIESNNEYIITNIYEDNRESKWRENHSENKT